MLGRKAADGTRRVPDNSYGGHDWIVCYSLYEVVECQRPEVTTSQAGPADDSLEASSSSQVSLYQYLRGIMTSIAQPALGPSFGRRRASLALRSWHSEM